MVGEEGLVGATVALAVPVDGDLLDFCEDATVVLIVDVVGTLQDEF